jgi:hypothetical protein
MHNKSFYKSLFYSALLYGLCLLFNSCKAQQRQAYFYEMAFYANKVDSTKDQYICMGDNLIQIVLHRNNYTVANMRTQVSTTTTTYDTLLYRVLIPEHNFFFEIDSLSKNYKVLKKGIIDTLRDINRNIVTSNKETITFTRAPGDTVINKHSYKY